MPEKNEAIQGLPESSSVMGWTGAHGRGAGVWWGCGLGVQDLSPSGTSGLSDLLLEFGLFPEGAFAGQRGRAPP